MADTNQKILIDLSVIDNFNESEKKIKSYTSSIKSLKDENAKLKAQQREVEAQLKANLITEAQAEVKLSALTKKIGENTQQVKQRKAEIASEKKAQEDCLASISSLLDTQNELIKTSTSLGETLAKLKESLSDMKGMSLDGFSPDEIASINAEMETLSTAIEVVKEKMNGIGNLQQLKEVETTLGAAAAATTVFSETLALVGVESETLNQVQQTIGKLVTITQSLATISTFLNTVRVKSLLTTKQQSAANIAQAATTAGLTVATSAWAVAQKVLNAAMKAFPLFAIIGGVTALIGGIKSLVSWLWGESDASKEATKALNDYKATVEETQSAIQQINKEEASAVKALKEKHREEILLMQQRGATVEELAQAEIRQQQELTDLTIEESEKREEQLNKEKAANEKAVEKQEAYVTKLDAKAKKSYENMVEWNNRKLSYLKTEEERQQLLDELRDKAYKDAEKERKKLEELTDQQKDLNRQLLDEASIRHRSTNDTLEKSVEQDTKRDKQQQEEAEKQKQRYISVAKQAIQQKKDLSIALLKSEEGYLSEDFNLKQKYDRDIFTLEQNAAKDLLNLQRKNGEIARTEYQYQLDMLTAAETEFRNKQQKEQDNHAKALLKEQGSVQKQLAKLMKDEFKLQRIEVTQEYESTIEDIEALMKKLPQDSEEYKQLAMNIVEVREKMSEDLAAIDKKEADQKSLNAVVEQAKKDADEQLAIYADSEQKKYEIELERLLKIKKAKEELDMDTSKEDSAIKDTESSIEATKLAKIQAEVAAELAAKNLSANERYRITREGLMKERALYEGNAEKQAEIDLRVAALDAEHQEKRKQNLMEYIEFAQEAMGSLFELSNAQDEAKLQKATEQNDQEKQQLKAQLDANLISKDEYNKKVKESDDKLAKEQAKVKRKQAIQEKISALFSAGINTAMSIVASAKPGFPAAIPFVAMSAAMGAMQMAAIMAAPLPKAARGMYLKGASHARGGIQLEAEGGEMVINKKSSGMFAPLLSAINEAGGGVPFVSTSSDGGFAMREYRRNDTQSVTSDAIATAVKEAVQEVKIYTAIEDINKGQAQYAVVANDNIF